MRTLTTEFVATQAFLDGEHKGIPEVAHKANTC